MTTPLTREEFRAALEAHWCGDATEDRLLAHDAALRARLAEAEAALRECVVSLEQFKRLVAQQNVPHWWVQEDEDALVGARRALLAPERPA